MYVNSIVFVHIYETLKLLVATLYIMISHSHTILKLSLVENQIFLMVPLLRDTVKRGSLLERILSNVLLLGKMAMRMEKKDIFSQRQRKSVIKDRYGTKHTSSPRQSYESRECNRNKALTKAKMKCQK
jgi:hypothetical protein